MIKIFHSDIEIADFIYDKKRYFLNYKNLELENSISLSLPNTQKIYSWKYRFPPYFETFLPEGYLFEIFKNLLTKEYGYIDDYLLFSLLSPNIDGRITFESENKKLNFDFLDIDEILNNDTQDTFNYLLNQFLDKNAISGVQPKTIALIRDKETLDLKEYIVKTWGDEFENLAENEYFCLKAVQKAGVPIPNIYLSKNRRFLIVEKFIYDGDLVYGFEEVLSLMDKNRNSKYQGSYEQVAKVINSFVTNSTKSMEYFFKTVVMNYLLKNGDAHLKNFGLLFNDDFSEIRFSPAYDIVTTTAYIFKDKPALTLNGKKIWHTKNELINFGVKHCNLSKTKATLFYEECKKALESSIDELEIYIKDNPHFNKIGKRMIDSWKLSLLEIPIKEIDDDVIRNWRSY
ncbi:type II toxin-antitoxin system HipA family toxin [Hydrogenimonas thermophila]|uniref:type II toxin-antitoxin system HipA family toxin n=1 Tax=Hydrogenimonas thermophila TaxID=223786 RepID=UPI002936E4DD|nr:type II toxin-antitoxin system HipA family toxin [Hydrogenimonas thermophila]WOE68957.1 type II toxin-antitoxin system HipA family toxin [Hydrogenimonas thermophila]WOE71464.1 type II toxin-antitoxin system HipA family toxin [Hydrogenimonas thermophila]